MQLIRSRRVVIDGEIQSAGILMRDHQITEIQPYDSPWQPQITKVFDFGDAVVMPGLIDAHVHINEPGRTEWEGFESATRSAACGGITLLADMPLNSTPVTITADAFHRKRKSAEGRIHTDCTFYGGLIPGNHRHIEELLDEGVAGIKVFLCPSGLTDFPAVTEVDLKAVMPVLAEKGVPLLAHAELQLSHSAPASPMRTYKAYAESRPSEWEEKAVESLIRLCRDTQCRVHVVHVASVRAASLIADAKREGLPISCETAPHYLFFESDEVPDGDTRFKCAPPIRDDANRRGLQKALRDGIIDFVATDHSPCPPEMKRLDTGDFSRAWGGIASLQLLLPALWTAMKDTGATLPDMAAWLSGRPARMLGLDRTHGRIAPGFRADFTVWDPEATFTVNGQELRHRHPLTPYEGRRLCGAVVSTFLRGRRIFNGTKLTEQNHGHIIANFRRNMNE